jgi:predicted acylesterase/phospholipase RssA
VHVDPNLAVRKRHLPFETVALVLQGGGALDAYQAGVYEALAEADIHPNWIAGISIGAIVDRQARKADRAGGRRRARRNGSRSSPSWWSRCATTISPDTGFRHGTTLLRWRPDKSPRQCTMDQVEQKAADLTKLLR